MAKPSKVQLPDCSLPFTESIAPVMSARISDFWELAPHISDEHNIKGLHDLRIAGKRLRYCLEFFAGVIGDEVEGPIASFKQLQNYLGEIHDCDVWLAMLGDPGGEGFPAEETTSEVMELVSRRRSETYRLLVAFWHGLEAEGFRDALEQTAGAVN